MNLLLSFFTVFLFSFTNITHAKVVIAQKELLKLYLKDLNKGPVFEKRRNVLVRTGKAGEKIKTNAINGFETISIVKHGDYVIQNQTKSKEQHIIPKNKFEKKYIYLRNIDEVWDEYKSLSELQAIQILNNKDTFYIMSPRGEKMAVNKGDFLIKTLCGKDEIYTIHRKEFINSYKLKK